MDKEKITTLLLLALKRQNFHQNVMEGLGYESSKDLFGFEYITDALFLMWDISKENANQDYYIDIISECSSERICMDVVLEKLKERS